MWFRRGVQYVDVRGWIPIRFKGNQWDSSRIFFLNVIRFITRIMIFLNLHNAFYYLFLCFSLIITLVYIFCCFSKIILYIWFSDVVFLKFDVVAVENLVDNILQIIFESVVSLLESSSACFCVRYSIEKNWSCNRVHPQSWGSADDVCHAICLRISLPYEIDHWCIP